MTPAGSSTVHIYTQTIHRKTQLIWKESRPCPIFASYTLAFALQLRKKHGKTSVGVAEECQLARWKENIHVYIYIYIYMSVYMCVCMCIYVYIYIYIHTRDERQERKPCYMFRPYERHHQAVGWIKRQLGYKVYKTDETNRDLTLLYSHASFNDGDAFWETSR